MTLSRTQLLHAETYREMHDAVQDPFTKTGSFGTSSF
jgi:hypothetical protein